MSGPRLDAHALEELLQEVALRVRELRGILLVDANGLALVSTLGARGFEESLAAFTGALEGLLERARADFQMGPLQQLRIAGRDRQLLVTPVVRGMSLLAVAESGATASTIEVHLAALARAILESMLAPPEEPAPDGAPAEGPRGD